LNLICICIVGVVPNYIDCVIIGLNFNGLSVLSKESAKFIFDILFFKNVLGLSLFVNAIIIIKFYNISYYILGLKNKLEPKTPSPA
jgi:hypothetical protein